MRNSGYPSSVDSNGHTDLKLGKLFLHHWKDWVFVVFLFIIEIVLNVIHPYRRYLGKEMFVTGEYMYPMVKQTVPIAAVPVIAIVIPMLFVLSFFAWRRSSRDLHHAILGLLTAVLLTAVITDSLKDGLGFPRPDFFARCFGNVANPPIYDVNGNVACTGDAAEIKEGYKSFPSGHSSWSFAGLGYLTMYLAGKIGFFDRRGHLWKFFPIVVPLLTAAFVGISRIDNYWHRWSDVLMGAILGLVVAYFAYRLHYPSLFDDAADSPLPFMGVYHRSGSIPLAATSYPQQHHNGEDMGV